MAFSPISDPLWQLIFRFLTFGGWCLRIVLGRLIARTSHTIFLLVRFGNLMESTAISDCSSTIGTWTNEWARIQQSSEWKIRRNNYCFSLGKFPLIRREWCSPYEVHPLTELTFSTVFRICSNILPYLLQMFYASFISTLTMEEC